MSTNYKVVVRGRDSRQSYGITILNYIFKGQFIIALYIIITFVLNIILMYYRQ